MIKMDNLTDKMPKNLTKFREDVSMTVKLAWPRKELVSSGTEIVAETTYSNGQIHRLHSILTRIYSAIYIYILFNYLPDAKHGTRLIIKPLINSF